MKERIGIFGGTFDPIHSGHVAVALKAAAEHGLDSVLVVPAAKNPFKEGRGRDALRWTLVKYACAPHKILVPCDFELRRGGDSYTIDTVREAARLHPGAELFLITGDDIAPDIPRWKDADEIVRLAKIATYRRTAESSTSVRRKVAEGKDPSGEVPPPVADFLDAKCVVFDFGGVISVSPRTADWPLVGYCREIGLSDGAFERGWRRHRAEWDGGECTFERLYETIFAEAGLPPPDKATIDRLWKLDAESWVERLSQETLALMGDLKASGKKIGILTNMSADFHSRLFVPRCGAYRALADAEIVSGIERMVKPDRAIFELAAERLGCAPGDILFLDDTPGNVSAARKCGWRALEYRAEK